MSNASPKIALFAGVVLLTSMAGVMFFLLTPQSASEMHPAVPAVAPGPEPSPLAPPIAAPVEADRLELSATGPEPGASGQRKPSSTTDRMGRDLKREQIWQALGQAHSLEPAAPGSAAPADADRLELPSLDPQYIQEAIQDQLVPVALECYESALEDDAELAGQLLLEFTIVGAEDVGGVVEDAKIQDDSTLDSAFVRECIRESTMAVSFEPPTSGGSLTVVYPINFEPE